MQVKESKKVAAVAVWAIHISSFSSLSWVLSLTKFFEEACKFGHQDRSKSFGRALLKLRREREGGAGLRKKRRRGVRNMHGEGYSRKNFHWGEGEGDSVREKNKRLRLYCIASM